MKSNLTAELEMIQRTRFWGEYVMRINRYREMIKEELVTKEGANLSYAQGACAAIKKIVNTPNEIIRTETENAKSEAKQDNLRKGPSTSD